MTAFRKHCGEDKHPWEKVTITLENTVTRAGKADGRSERIVKT
jgi:hypothetical protein